MKAIWLGAVALGCLSTGCGAVKDVHDGHAHARPIALADEEGEDGDDGSEQWIALDQVPAAVRTAAETAVPGLVLKSAETEREEGALHYCLEGTAAGEKVEVEVGPDGRVLEVERGDEDEDEDED